jgi:hypothetical protein
LVQFGGKLFWLDQLIISVLLECSKENQPSLVILIHSIYHFKGLSANQLTIWPNVNYNIIFLAKLIGSHSEITSCIQPELIFRKM